MKKSAKIIAVIQSLLMLMPFFFACNNSSNGGETPTSAQSSSEESETPTTAQSSSEESEIDSSEESSSVSEPSESDESQEASESTLTTEPAETEAVEDLISFIDYTSPSSRGLHDLKTGGDVAVSFTIPEGYLKNLYLNLTDKSNYTDCSFYVTIHAFDGKYDTSAATEPLFCKHITSTLRSYTLDFDEGQLPAGKYLMIVSYADLGDSDEANAEEEAHYTSIVKDLCWLPRTCPDELDPYRLRYYTNGKQDKKYSICGGIVVSHNEIVEDNESSVPEDSTGSDNESDGENDANKVKVILLAGQSNATGSSKVSYLKSNVSDEQYKKYVNGFSNVKILYTNGTNSGGIIHSTLTEEFVDAKLGQGYEISNFGPELGLAEYLSEAYPDETIYIIKYAIGGTGLLAHWNPTDSERSVCLDNFNDKIELGLSLLEDEGYTPEIVAFLWMQGEADASTFNRAYTYYDLQKALVEGIREKYADHAAEGGIAFIDAAISDSGYWASWYLLNNVKARYSEESSINYFIDTTAAGLTTLYENNDLAHYDSMSMLQLGNLFGQALHEHLSSLD